MVSSLIAYLFSGVCLCLSGIGAYRFAWSKDTGREHISCVLIIALAFAAYWLARVAEH